MKVWRVNGEFRKLRRRFPFSRELAAEKEAHARERVLSELGSHHRVPRKDILIRELKEIKPEEIVDPVLKKSLGLESAH